MITHTAVTVKIWRETFCTQIIVRNILALSIVFEIDSFSFHKSDSSLVYSRYLCVSTSFDFHVDFLMCLQCTLYITHDGRRSVRSVWHNCDKICDDPRIFDCPHENKTTGHELINNITLIT